MRLLLLAAAALTASAGVAYADQPANVGAKADRAFRQILVCDRSAATSESWLRECAGSPSGVGLADQPRSAERAPRQVFVCERSAETRSNWIREYGAITFVTADELSRAETTNERWLTPRCMTAAEMRRFAKGRPEAATLARAINLAAGM